MKTAFEKKDYERPDFTVIELDSETNFIQASGSTLEDLNVSDDNNF